MADLIQRHDPARELYVATPNGVRFMRVVLVQFNSETGIMDVQGYIWSGNKQKWSKTKVWRRPLTGKCYTDKAKATAVFQERKAAWIAAAQQRLAIAKADLTRLKRRGP